jgi:hypothetical protein
MNETDFLTTQQIKMSPEEIAKKVNKKIFIMGLAPEEWSWCGIQSSIIVFSLVLVSIVFINIGLEALGDFILTFALLSYPFMLYFSAKILKIVTRRFGDNTAFLVLSQHNPIAVLFNKKIGTKNYTYKPQPNNNHQSIE